MKDLIIWIIIWYAVWGTFNAKLRWSLEQFKSRKYIGRGLFFLFSFLVIYFLYYNNLVQYSLQLLVSVVIANIIGLYFSFNHNFFKKFSKDRFFILFQTFNILFQQASILVAMLLLKRLIGNQYTDLYFGLFFVGIHLPLLLLPWVKLKYYILASCFFGGWLFSYLNFSYTNGIVFSFLIHYLLYVFEIYYLKDEEKI